VTSLKILEGIALPEGLKCILTSHSLKKLDLFGFLTPVRLLLFSLNIGVKA